MKERRDSEYKPYFYLPHPLSKMNAEDVRSLFGEVEVANKRNLFTNEMKEFTKVEVHNPSHIKKASKSFETIWETEIDYAQSYIYDHDLIFGASYTIAKNEFVVADNIPQELGDKFEEAFAEVKVADPQKYDQIKHWFNLLHQPIPEVKPEHLGLKEINPEGLLHAFSLARLVNIPIAVACKSRRVSDWLKSMIHNYLRKENFLIPTSKELRRGIKTHRVPGALTVTPKAGAYFNTVVCDFESLYPSCIDNYNLSYETVNCQHKECGKNRIEECPEHWVCTRRRGFYSMLVGALKDLRIRWFKPISKNREVSVQERRRAQAMADLLKLLSVSSYGVTVRIHGLACPPLAECITGYGRWALQTTWNLAETKGLRPIYGDTDSIFLDNPQPEQVEELIEKVRKKLRLTLAIERQYSICVLPAAKKAYFGLLPGGKPDIKGLTVVKSNSPNFIQKVFQDCVEELRNVGTVEEYESAKRRMIEVVQRAVSELRNLNVKLKDLVYSVKLFFDPNERLATNVKAIPQPYQCAAQLLDMGKKVDKGDSVCFIKVKPFNYKNKTFTVKPLESVKSIKEINVEDYIRNLTTALEQTFSSMGIVLRQEMDRKISDWFGN